MFAVAPLRPEDRAEWLELLHGYLTFYESRLDEATIDSLFTRMLAHDPEIHGALARDADGQAIGLVHWLTHASTWTTADYCYLEDLFVAPDARGMGVGAALIEHVRAWAKDHGSEKVYWLTADANATARRLYDRVAQQSGFIHYEMTL